jgi:hypothetical protein
MIRKEKERLTVPDGQRKPQLLTEDEEGRKSTGKTKRKQEMHRKDK